MRKKVVKILVSKSLLKCFAVCIIKLLKMEQTSAIYHQASKTNHGLKTSIARPKKALSLLTDGHERLPYSSTEDVTVNEIMNAAVGAAYIHLPFCRRRCYYCDFPIQVVGDRPGAAEKRYQPYLDALKREIVATKNSGCFSPDKCPGVRNGGLESIFFGGGTPSLVEPRELATVLDLIEETYGIAQGAEISMEMDPGTFDEARLRKFIEAGITRVSLGVQSFDGQLLKAAGRAHTPEDTDRALKDLFKVGVDNFGIDLISGLPHLTLEKWNETLDCAIKSGAKHISVYDLQVEEGTAFGRWYSPGVMPLPTDDDSAEMYRAASQKLGEAGFNHYEVSNYARPGYESYHNCVYWESKPFLAFGNAAASYLGGYRFSRPHSIPDYIKWVEVLEKQNWNAASKEEEFFESEKEKEKEWLLESIMVGLRLKKGVSLSRIREHFGAAKVEDVLNSLLTTRNTDDPYCKRNASQIVLYDHKLDRLYLNDPEGFMLSNQIISTIFSILV